MKIHALVLVVLGFTGIAPATSLPTPSALVLGLPDDAETPDIAEAAEKPSPWKGSSRTRVHRQQDDHRHRRPEHELRRDPHRRPLDVGLQREVRLQLRRRRSEGQLPRRPDGLRPTPRGGLAVELVPQRQLPVQPDRVLPTASQGLRRCGYFISNTDDLQWSARGRCGYELGRTRLQQRLDPESRVEHASQLEAREGITLQGSASFEPAFRDFSDYLTVLELNVNIALAMMDNLSMYFTLRDEYNSNPAEGDSYNQVWVTLGFSYGF